MRYLKTLAFAASTVLVLGLGGISPASAQRGMHGGGFHGGGFHAGSFRGGWHGGGWRGRGWGWGPAVAGGLAFGALATAPYWGGYAYDCGPGVVRYDYYGNPIVVDGCY
jgi:hypothetical protein